jgi:hypothetical protein
VRLVEQGSEDGRRQGCRRQDKKNDSIDNYIDDPPNLVVLYECMAGVLIRQVCHALDVQRAFVITVKIKAWAC